MWPFFTCSHFYCKGQFDTSLWASFPIIDLFYILCNADVCQGLHILEELSFKKSCKLKNIFSLSFIRHARVFRQKGQ